MSITLIGNYIQLASHFLVLFGFRELSQDESNSVAITIGVIGELVGWLTTHIGRVRLGGVTLLGGRK